MIDIEAIKKAASRAPEGDYEAVCRDDESGAIDYVIESDEGELAICYDATDSGDATRAKYAAEWFAIASPTTVLELVAEIERLRKAPTLPANVQALVEEIEKLRRENVEDAGGLVPS